MKHSLFVRIKQERQYIKACQDLVFMDDVAIFMAIWIS